MSPHQHSSNEVALPADDAVQTDARGLTLGLLTFATGIALVDALVANPRLLIVLLLFAPLGAAARLPWRRTAVVAAYTLALAIPLGFLHGSFSASDHVVRTLLVTASGALAIWIAASRERLERARWRYSVIAEAGVVLGAARDHEVALITLARLAARRVCDWCFVYVVGEDGSLQQLAAAHRDPSREPLALELLRLGELDCDATSGPAAVARSGRSELHPSVESPLLAHSAADPASRRVVDELSLRSAMITSISAGGRSFGALVFASAESGRVFRSDDLPLAEDLARRAGAAVESARLYERLRATETDLRRSRDELRAILNGVADAVTVQDPNGLIYANAAALSDVGFESLEEMIAATPEQLFARYELLDEHGAPFPLERLPGRLAVLGEQPPATLVRYRLRATGEERWALIKATPVPAESGETALAINVIEDVTEQRRREEALRFLAESSRLLSESLEYEQTFRDVARLGARDLADWVVIEVLEDEGTIRRVASAHADPERLRIADRFGGRYRSGATEPSPQLRQVIRSGRGELHPFVTGELLAAVARDPEHLGLLLQFNLRSAMFVPMRAHGRIVGAISLWSAESGRSFGQSDLMLAEDLAARCALAVDNARLFRERSRIARTLQESLLPPHVPAVDGVDVATRFRAAGSGLEVGGDFYDLFDTGESGWAVAIGDVCGKGTEAASLTALARHTLRAAAMSQRDPARILALLNEALLRQRTDRRFCTVLYGTLRPSANGMTFDFASAGHPLPLVIAASGAASEAGKPGTLLGIMPDPEFTPASVDLAAGDALVLYTDGVTESGAPDRIWTADDLARAIGDCATLDADAIAQRLLDCAVNVPSHEPRDDIAIIVLKVPAPDNGAPVGYAALSSPSNA